jgi:hypothetical protein
MVIGLPTWLGSKRAALCAAGAVANGAGAGSGAAGDGVGLALSGTILAGRIMGLLEALLLSVGGMPGLELWGAGEQHQQHLPISLVAPWVRLGVVQEGCSVLQLALPISGHGVPCLALGWSSLDLTKQCGI